jgi:hypothetical protein
MGPLICDRCEALLADYRESVVALARSVASFAEVSRGRELALYRRVWNEAEKANLECARLRRVILLHLESHENRR